MQTRRRRVRDALFATIAILMVIGAGSTLFFVPRLVEARWGDRADSHAPSSALTFDWTGTVAAGRAVILHGVNGGVVADGAPGSNVVVHAVKSARRHDPSEVQIKSGRRPNGDMVFYALYPGGGNSYADGVYHARTRDNDVKVEWEVHVPREVAFQAHVLNGNVRAQGIRGNVVVETVNGGISVETTGTTEATTVNGSIDAAVGSTAWGGTLAFTTVNGSIDVTLPRGLGAQLEAETVNGRITTDYPVTVQGSIGKRHLRGVIGDGGGTLKLETVNGGIRVNRRV